MQRRWACRCSDARSSEEAVPEQQAIQFLADPPAQTSFANLYDSVAPSPDGRFVVFLARAETTDASSLWLRPLDSASERPLQGTDSALFPTWSPDSRSIAFFTEGKLKRIEIAGGAPLTLCDASIGVAPGGATWNRNAIILFGGGAGLHRVSASSGTPALVTTVDVSRKETGHGFPQFMPDGNRFCPSWRATMPTCKGSMPVPSTDLASAHRC